MPRKKRIGEAKSILVELDLGDPQQKAVWENWQMLAESGQAADWARVALIRALMVSTDKPPVRLAPPLVPFQGIDQYIHTADAKPEPHYEPDEENTGRPPNPDDIIRQRRAAAKQKFGR